MSLKPGEDIGAETHELDQFIRCEAGWGKVILNGVEQEISEGSVVIVPAGTNHNIVNISAGKAMKLYTLYAPPNHREGTIHRTKLQAESDEEHFDGKITE